MNFLAPMAFVFAAALPVVIVFYLLKRKRVVRLVSSTILWQRFLSESQASAPFQKLRRNWLLILQLLLLTLVVFALARPYFAAKVKPAHIRVVILDASASMQSIDEIPSRFERARAEALKWVDGLAGQDQMVILQAGASTEVKQSATSEKAALRRALAACTASDGPTRLVPALRMAESLVRDQSGAEIHLFSDGAVPELREFENKALPLVFHRVGIRGENAGIIALDARANPENPQQRAVYVSVANYGTNTVKTDLELRLDGRLLHTRPLTLEPGNTSPQVFLAAQAVDGVFQARLTGADDLAADNEASLVSLLPKPVDVLLVSRGNRLLERALRSVPQVRLATATGLSDSARGFGFVVLDGVVPAVWPEGNVLAFDVLNTNWITGAIRLENPVVVDWRATHPLMRYVGFDNVQMIESWAVRTPTWALSLVEAPQASVMLAGEIGRQRVIWVGFDPLNSNWPLRVSFPIFIANAIEWLNPATAQSSQLQVKAGEAFRLPLVTPATTVQVMPPGGGARTIAVDPGAREWVFGETHQQGVYRARIGTNETTFCVNLLDAAESENRPRDTIQLGAYEKVEATTVKRANMEIWRTIAAAGLLLLLVEWWYYHRRTV